MTRPKLAMLRISRPPRPRGQLWQIPLFLLGSLVLVFVAGSSPLRVDPAYRDFHYSLVEFREGVQKKSRPYTDLIAQGENLLAAASKYPHRMGEVVYTMATAYFQQAEEAGEAGVEPRQQALNYYEKAYTLDVPSADVAKLRYRLGWLLVQQGLETLRGLELMSKNVDRGADVPNRGYGLLVQVYLNLEPPDHEAALTANQKQMETIADDDEALAQARLSRAQILHRIGQKSEALKVLDRIGATASRAARLQARFLQARLCQEENLWRRAIPFWRELLEDPNLAPGGAGRIHLELGLCHANAEPAELDHAAKSWQEAAAWGGDEGQAAALRLGDLKLSLGDFKGAILWWTQGLAKVTTPADYQNPYLDIAKLRDLFEQPLERFLEQEQPAQSWQMALLYRKIAQPGVAEEWMGKAGVGVAKSLAAETSADNPEVVDQYRRAGEAFEMAAFHRPQQQTALLWQSAACYRQAKDSAKIIPVLEKFTKFETQERRLAEGWLLLAEAYTEQKQPDRARQAYYKCMEIPETPFAPKAGFQLALEELDRNNKPQAIAILKQNLTGAGAMADRVAHELSLYKLGTLLATEQLHDQALHYLKEATRQYPNNPGVFSARDLLGECYRKLAEQAGKRLLPARPEEPKSGLSDEQLAYFRRSQVEWQKQALATYQALADDLDAQVKEKRSMQATDALLLRKALFSVGDIYFEMNDLVEALRRYQSLQENYRKQVEGLIAFQRIWLCVGRVGFLYPPDAVQRVREVAKSSYVLIKEDLDAMDENHESFRGGAGVWTRKNWLDWLAFVGSQLNPPAPQPARTGVVPSGGVGIQ